MQNSCKKDLPFVKMLAIIRFIQIDGSSPSGKAAGFDPAMRWFESSRPSHQFSQIKSLSSLSIPKGSFPSG